MKINEEDLNLKFFRDRKYVMRYLFLIIALLAILFLSYSNSFNCSWHFDDYANITKNKNIQINEFTWEKIKNISYGIINTGRISRPVSYLSFAINYYFGGFNVFGYHIVNFLIHFFTSIFLFLFIINTLKLPLLKANYEKKAYSIALLATVFWAINPLHVTTVTYIVQRMAGMAALFYIMAMYFYIKLRTSEVCFKSVLFIILCAISSLLAFGTKENSAILPVSILLYELLLIQGVTKENIKKIIKMLIIPLGILIIIGLLFYDFSSIFEEYKSRAFTMQERLLTEPRVILFYISLLFYPLTSRLTFYHDIEISKGLFEPWTTFAAIIILLLIIIWAIAKSRKWPLLAYCILFFFLNHIIEGSFLPLDLIYEHRNYLPSMLLFVPVAVALVKGLDFFLQRKIVFYFLAAVISCIMIIQGVTVYMQNIIMRDEISFWRDNVDKSPRLYIPHQNLAVALFVSGRLNESFDELKKADNAYESSLKNRKSSTYGAMGEYFFITGNDQKAFEFYNKSIEYYPLSSQLPHTSNRIATLLLRKGDLKRAEEMVNKAITLKPYEAEYYLTYSAILLKKGQSDEAIKKAQKALMLNSDLSFAYSYIADAFKLKKNKNAEMYFRKLSLKNSSGRP